MVVLSLYIGIFAGLPPPSSTACGAEFDNSRLAFSQYDDDDDDIYIMVKCLFVCQEKSTLPPGSLL